MIHPTHFLAGAFLCLLTLGSGEKPVAEIAPAEVAAERMLVGEIVILLIMLLLAPPIIRAGVFGGRLQTETRK